MKKLIATTSFLISALSIFGANSAFANQASCAWINLDSDNWDETYLSQAACSEMFKNCGGASLNDLNEFKASLEVRSNQVTAITTNIKKTDIGASLKSTAKFDKSQFDNLTFQKQKEGFTSKALGAMCVSVKNYSAALLIPKN